MSQELLKGMRGACLSMVFAGALMVSPWAAAQSQAPAAASPGAVSAFAAEAEQVDDLDEVVVTGVRLYDRIVKAEDKFFKLYNELNKDHDFDTNCANVAVNPDSRIEQRFCMPSFFAEALADEVRLAVYCQSLQSKDSDGNVTSDGACYQPPESGQLFLHRRNDYVNNIVKVINSDQRLMKVYIEVEMLHRQRAAYERRYEVLKAEKVSDKSKKTQRGAR